MKTISYGSGPYQERANTSQNNAISAIAGGKSESEIRIVIQILASNAHNLTEQVSSLYSRCEDAGIMRQVPTGVSSPEETKRHFDTQLGNTIYDLSETVNTAVKRLMYLQDVLGI